ncbi:PREDICTED: uncharacterized protein LOC104566831 [Tinamus guttatus]|uniref:uncharacterized protein LOC104566831 n=1 Tax=Tinamus guttatus TaxID=94827 RepID=UPI00052F0952|nr:PREDICTED: uncharacterized protein LOC104566831 [Tinamus guttatus]
MDVDMAAWDQGRSPSGKILSLDRQGAKKVLEIYVRRSLSCCESSLAAKRRAQERAGGKRAAKLQRSKSDFCNYSCSKISPRKDQEEGPNTSDLEEALDNTSKAWFKSFLNFLFRKNPDDQKENAGQKAKEKDIKAPHSTKSDVPRRPGTDVNTAPPPGKHPRKRPSLKRVFSFKKHVGAEEERGEAAAGAKARRPNRLLLRHIQTPASTGTDQPDCYYAQVSEEIGLIVHGSESHASGQQRFQEPQGPAGADGVEEAIRRIVALLQSTGDDLDRKVKEDARLRMFFKEMSYSSFKNLADAYVSTEMTASRPNINPQEIQFAFAVHLTAKVAGICNQAVNRIMGFGTRYLEDSFAPLSYGKILQDRDQFNTENCESPD